jgi:5S rRNA maturation endonuclease (ribonuclease M5)
VLEELWDALDLAASDESVDTQSDSTTADDLVFALQSTIPDKHERRHTLKLLARIGKHQVLVLVDSGSVGTFVNDKLVQALGLHTEPCQSVTFKAIDGG